MVLPLTAVAGRKEPAYRYFQVDHVHNLSWGCGIRPLFLEIINQITFEVQASLHLLLFAN